MIELLILTIGISAMFWFSKSIKSISQASEAKTQIFAEKVISEAVQERAEILQEFKTNTKDKEILSHDDMMKMFKID